MPGTEPAWTVVERCAAADELVTSLPDAGGARLACLCVPVAPALVLGSAQQTSAADAAALDRRGVDVVHRRSGGGAVLVAPADQVWLDVFLPSRDPLVVADVGRSAWWFGELWRSALTSCGLPPGDLEVHRAGLEPGPWSRIACFAGLGPGEVTYRGRKLVGISQRRTRAGAWLHSMAPSRFDSALLVELLGLDQAGRDTLRRVLDRCVATLPVAPERVTSALRVALARRDAGR